MNGTNQDSKLATSLAIANLLLTFVASIFLAIVFHLSDRQLQQELTQRNEALMYDLTTLQENLQRQRNFAHLSISPCARSACATVTNTGPAIATDVRVLFLREWVNLQMPDSDGSETIDYWTFVASPPLLRVVSNPKKVNPLSRGTDATELELETLAPGQTLEVQISVDTSRTGLGVYNHSSELIAPQIEGRDIAQAITEALDNSSPALARFRVSATCDNCEGGIEDVHIPFYARYLRAWLREPSLQGTGQNAFYEGLGLLAIVLPSPVTDLSQFDTLRFITDDTSPAGLSWMP